MKCEKEKGTKEEDGFFELKETTKINTFCFLMWRITCTKILEIQTLAINLTTVFWKKGGYFLGKVQHFFINSGVELIRKKENIFWIMTGIKLLYSVYKKAPKKGDFFVFVPKWDGSVDGMVNCSFLLKRIQNNLYLYPRKKILNSGGKF